LRVTGGDDSQAEQNCQNPQYIRLASHSSSPL
jgi:hypothetical protein